MSTHPGATRLITAVMFGFAGLAMIVTGCSSTSKVAQNAKGSVFLEEIMDWSFEASHPAVIDQTTLLKIVKGVYTAEDQNGSTRMSAAGSKPMRVFSDEDAEFLAPLLAQGLSKAKPEQLVGFRVSSSAGSGSEPTAGSIYLHQGAIHFTISKGPGATTFIPESAARSEQAPTYASGGKAGVITQVIDYHALANTPMPAAVPVTKTTMTQSSAAKVPAAAYVGAEAVGPVEAQAQLTRAKEMLSKKDTEISVLRKESDWMKRELRERDEEIKALKATVKAPPKKKKAEARPTRPAGGSPNVEQFGLQ
ncbi:MAG TPA: hypothetical protein VL261_06100 [Nitrospira sp.]|jgi:hypothetical protein|nr:hypothetical protein [Nitrospira sp.]